MSSLARAVFVFVCVAVFADHAFGTTYYIAASGSDSNSGTSMSSPWLHAPGMPTCAATCASVTPNPGDQFIFRGGDTWHFGNSSASPYTGGTWTWTWNGTSSSYIYIGVDQTWYSGSSWTRPILTGDNPTSTVAVSSCTYTTGSENQLVSFNGTEYHTFDNFEMTGYCQASSSVSYGGDAYIVVGDTGPEEYENIYAHGWTHLAWSCGSYCFDSNVFVGASQGQEVLYQVVIDGSDSDPAGIAADFNAVYDIHDSVIRYTANLLGGNCHTFHDNLVEYSYEPGDGVAHGNIYECNGEASASTPNSFYNNVIRNAGLTVAMGVGLWPEPGTSQTDYYFNNVVYNNDCDSGACFNLGQNSSNQGTLVLFNNTMQTSGGTALVKDNGTTTYTHPLLTDNNHWITSASNGVSTAGSWTSTTDLTMSPTTATTDGYTASEPFAYSPTASGDPTVGKGTSTQSTYCAALSGDSLAYAACQKSTDYGVAYNSTNHTVTLSSGLAAAALNATPNIGAYQYGQAPGVPTNLTGIVVVQ